MIFRVLCPDMLRRDLSTSPDSDARRHAEKDPVDAQQADHCSTPACSARGEKRFGDRASDYEMTATQLDSGHGSIQEMVRDCLAADQPDPLGLPIRVCNYNEELYTLDNRRLAAKTPSKRILSVLF